MTHRIEKIIEKQDGQVFIVSRAGASTRIMRARYMETSVPITTPTHAIINYIKDKK